MECGGRYRSAETCNRILCILSVYVLCGRTVFWRCRYHWSLFCRSDYLYDPERAVYCTRFDVLSYTYLSPIFFASIGLKVSLPEMNGTIVAFAVVLTIVAILTKVVGCGLGAKLCHYKNYQAIRIGVGMISRGEVALIVASKGESLGMMSTAVMGPVVIVVILTTIIAPILLKPVFKRGPETTPDPNVEYV